MSSAHRHRRRDNQVFRKHHRSGRRRIANEQPDVRLGTTFDSGIASGGPKSLRPKQMAFVHGEEM
jgi:hypothetical protein